MCSLFQRIQIFKMDKNLQLENLNIHMLMRGYKVLVSIFRKEAQTEEMRDLRHIIAHSYVEGDTEN